MVHVNYGCKEIPEPEATEYHLWSYDSSYLKDNLSSLTEREELEPKAYHLKEGKIEVIPRIDTGRAEEIIEEVPNDFDSYEIWVDEPVNHPWTGREFYGLNIRYPRNMDTESGPGMHLACSVPSKLLEDVLEDLK